jgi:hypothetical protein
LPQKQTSVERLAMVWMSTEIRDCICDLTHLSTCIRLLHTVRARPNSTKPSISRWWGVRRATLMGVRGESSKRGARTANRIAGKTVAHVDFRTAVHHS